MNTERTSAARSGTTVLAHFLPGDVIRQCNELSRKFEHDEAFKRYVVGEMGVVIVFGFLFFFLSLVSAVSPVLLLKGSPWPDNRGLLILALAMAVIAWFGSIYLQFFLLFSWLERRFNSRVDAGHNTPSKRKVPWAFVVVLIFVPLIVFVLLSPTVVLFLIALVLLAPILVTLFDQ